MSQLGPSKPTVRPKRLRHSRLLKTVFDLPELNDIIFSYLSRNDLVQWARVSKKWHYAVIPYIWYDLSTLTPARYLRLARMIINDYRTDGCQQSPLAKYCPLIRKLGYLSDRNLLRRFFLFDFIRLDVKGKESDNGDVVLSDVQWSTIHGSFCHFMMHCTHLNALALEFNTRDDGFYGTVKLVADSALQHLRHLSIHGSILEGAFKYLMTRCPVTLETLELGFATYTNDKHPSVIEANEAGQEPLANLRRLILRDGEDLSLESLSSFWKRCESVETLELTIRGRQSFQHMAAIIDTFFPNLNTISFGEDARRSVVDDESVASVLSASRLGWKSVSIMRQLDFGKRSWKALSRHASTLENFTMERWSNWEGLGPRPFLTSFPRLRSFVMLAEGLIKKTEIISIDANDWIHQDLLSGSPTPWLCESSLTDLRIRISGIPRPDIVRDYRGGRYLPFVEESYPGEGRMIQHRVYERLSRLVNLEVLWLGHNICDFAADEYSNQLECLEMSLESGLERLGGLKRLQALNVSLMATRIGQKEAQWMAEQWPKLCEIRGLDDKGDARKARQWFSRNCPRITTPS
ncbi:MAG: hypothetical protein J3Q66DRAFT_344815, partial [Benniella sp.]